MEVFGRKYIPVGDDYDPIKGELLWIRDECECNDDNSTPMIVGMVMGHGERGKIKIEAILTLDIVRHLIKKSDIETFRETIEGLPNIMQVNTSALYRLDVSSINKY